MEFTRKDALATVLVTVAVVVYAAYLVFDGFLFITDVPAMAGVALVLGFASRRIGGREGFAHERLAFAAGLGSMALGIVAVSTGSAVVLALFMISMVALWIAATYVRTGGHFGHVGMSR
jgi:hypothetical protein